MRFYEQVMSNINRLSDEGREKIARLLNVKAKKLPGLWTANRENFQDRAVEALMESGVGIRNLIETETRTGIRNVLRYRNPATQLAIGGRPLGQIFRNPDSQEAQMVEYLFRISTPAQQTEINSALNGLSDDNERINLNILTRIRAIHDNIKGEEFQKLGCKSTDTITGKSKLSSPPGSKIREQEEIVQENMKELRKIKKTKGMKSKAYAQHLERNQEDIQAHKEAIAGAKTKIGEYCTKRNELEKELRKIQDLSQQTRAAGGLTELKYVFIDTHLDNFVPGDTINAGCAASTDHLVFNGEDQQIGYWLTNDDAKIRIDRLRTYEGTASSRGRLDAKSVLDEVVRIRHTNLGLGDEQQGQIVGHMQGVVKSTNDITGASNESSTTPVATSTSATSGADGGGETAPSSGGFLNKIGTAFKSPFNAMGAIGHGATTFMCNVLDLTPPAPRKTKDSA